MRTVPKISSFSLKCNPFSEKIQLSEFLIIKMGSDPNGLQIIGVLPGTSRKTFQLLLFKMTAFCWHTVPIVYVWASRRSIYNSWTGEFLSPPPQSQSSVSRDFGASRHRYILPAPTTIYSLMSRGGLVIQFNEIWDVHLQSILHFFIL